MEFGDNSVGFLTKRYILDLLPAGQCFPRFWARSPCHLPLSPRWPAPACRGLFPCFEIELTVQSPINSPVCGHRPHLHHALLPGRPGPAGTGAPLRRGEGVLF